MKSVNKVILLGSVGHDPEVKYIASGIPVGRFRLATNERFKDKSGQFQDRTEWHNIVGWRRLAEIVGELVSKGSQLYIKGKLQTTSWEDRQSAEKKYRTEIVADDLVLLGSREKGSGAQPAGSDKAGKQKASDPAAGKAAGSRMTICRSKDCQILCTFIRLGCWLVGHDDLSLFGLDLFSAQ